jgi:selenocysteine lyase/cysteine desulfurase
MDKQFPITEQIIHLNHAAVGPWPRVTADAVKAFAEENTRLGSLHYPNWMKKEQDLREAVATLIHAASADEIALVKNTSEGLSMIAYGLDWQSGDNVVGILQEFPSNRYAWESLSSQGVEFRKLDLDAVGEPEQGLMDLCDQNTRLISVSAVQFYNGFRLDLARLGSFCRDQGILFCIDAIQQVGALPFDVQETGADFAVADGHKWMLSAEGLGFLYLRREVMDRLSLTQYGWHMVERIGDYNRQDFEPAHTARRFECGSPNMLGIHAMLASLELLLQTGMQDIGGKVKENTGFLIERLSTMRGVKVLSDQDDSRLSGIVTLGSKFMPGEKLHRLLSERGVLCAPRGGGVRLSPHFYTPREQLEQTLELIRDEH